MATVTDSDLQELKDLINGLDKKIDVNQSRTDEKLNSIDKRLIRLETKLETLEPSIQKIPDLAEKVGEMKNWRQISVGVVIAAAGAIIGYLSRNIQP
jgi:predicted nuclease with TOPRIM domain